MLVTPRFQLAYRAWLNLEQQLFLTRGQSDHPDVVAAKAILDPLWDALSDEEREAMKGQPVAEGQYPAALMAPQQVELREKFAKVLAGELDPVKVLEELGVKK